MKILILILLEIVLGFSISAQHIYKTTNFLMELNSSSEISKMVDLKANQNYAPEENRGYLIRVKSAGIELTPKKMERKDDMLFFTFENGIKLQVRTKQNQDYLRFELTKVIHPEMIDAVLWGSFNTTINETIGEVVGIVRNKDFAIGIQTLNPKTAGGKLVNEEGSTGGTTTATKEKFGSAIQAFCINQAKDRVMTVWNLHKNVPVKGLKDYLLEGSALTVFGTSPNQVLQMISKIELAEGLPHPVINGEWVKTSGATGQPYIISSFSEENIDEMLAYTKRVGFYSLYHSHPFKNWGHFDLLKRLFPNGREGMKQCVEKAREKGIRIGVHTLTNFITTDDSFVTTAANAGLMAAGISILEKNIDEKATEIVVDNYDYFVQIATLNSVLIGNEIIRYQSVSKEKPYTLINCVRGAFDTKATSHVKGAEAKKLMDYPYKTLFPDWPMMNEMIQNMANFFNETGVSHLDFDGHEGTCYSGRGDYAINYFAQSFLSKVNHLIVNGSSNVSHFYLHANSYINWGEPWYASFRESQSMRRFELQPFLERNYLPNMLGWFLLTSNTVVEDIEWMLSRAAGYNAGYALVADYKSFKENPNTDIIIDYIRLWEEAKKLTTFNEEQRIRLKDPEKDFHLEKSGSNQWKLQSFDKFKFEHQNKTLQPGEPTHSDWGFENSQNAQPIHLHLLVTGEEALVEQIEIEVDNFFKVKIPASLKKGQSVVWDGSEQVKLYNEKGQVIKTIAIDKSLPNLQKGKHALRIDAVFTGGKDPVIKGTVKLKGTTETINK